MVWRLNWDNNNIAAKYKLKKFAVTEFRFNLQLSLYRIASQKCLAMSLNISNMADIFNSSDLYYDETRRMKGMLYKL